MFYLCIILSHFVTLAIWKMLDPWVVKFIKCWHISLYSTKKSHLLLSPLISLQKLLGHGKRSSSWWQIQVFQILVFVKKVEFSHWQHLLSVISLKHRAWFVHFWENVCLIPMCEYIFVYQLFFQVKLVSMRKLTSSTHKTHPAPGSSVPWLSPFSTQHTLLLI